MMNVLITGGSGYLGRQLSKYLLENGSNVIIFDKNKRTDCETVQIDVANYKELKRSIEKYEFNSIIHLISKSNISKTENDFIGSYEANITSLKNVIHCSRNLNIKLIYTSSAAIYGIQKIPMKEDYDPHPINLYGLYKYFCEELIKKECEKYGIIYSILRLFNIYNDKENDQMIINKIHYAKESSIKLKLHGIYQLRDFVYIDDVLKIIKETLTNISTSNRTINVGSGKGYTINEIMKLFLEYHDFDYEIVNKSKDTHDSVADITLLRKLFSYEPQDVKMLIRDKLLNEN